LGEEQRVNQDAGNLQRIDRTLDQELAALVRGVSLECLVCGEFVLQARGALACPECGSIIAEGREIPRIELPSVVQAG
jgi:Zn finger protein HypA/HybF involved in hydrogenase expression